MNFEAREWSCYEIDRGERTDDKFLFLFLLCEQRMLNDVILFVSPKNFRSMKFHLQNKSINSTRKTISVLSSFPTFTFRPICSDCRYITISRRKDNEAEGIELFRTETDRISIFFFFCWNEKKLLFDENQRNYRKVKRKKWFEKIR